MTDQQHNEIRRLKTEIERLRRQLIVERTWREELQKLSIDQAVEVERLQLRGDRFYTTLCQRTELLNEARAEVERLHRQGVASYPVG